MPGPRLEVITGPMFSGKSEELIRRLRRFQYAKQRVLVIKPRTDTRQSDEIATKILNRATGKFEKRDNFPALNVENRADILKHLQENAYDVIAIDEGQFFGDWLVEFIAWSLQKMTEAKREVLFLVSGLDMDAWQRPFGPMPQLLAMADHVHKVPAICFRCGDKATLTQKISGSGDQIEVGADKLYEARCRQCHTLPV